MDVGKYIDFNHPTLNMFYGFVHDKQTNSYKFSHIHGKHLVAGDTDSAMLAVPDDLATNMSIDDIIKCADVVGNTVNESFPDFVKFAFNAPTSRCTTIKTAREVVADKSFFLSKKRYILHIVDSDGKRVDKLKIQGVEIKKSGTSKFTRSTLSAIVNLILDGAKAEDVAEYIEQQRVEFWTASITDISSISNCKTLKPAQDYYEAFGSIAKGTHYTAKAAMHYNMRCTNKDPKINPGEKIRLIYCRDAISVIAFPVDMITLPDWFDDIIIDRELMWTKTKKTVTNYLEAMKFDLASRKKQLSADLFGF